MQQVTKVKQVTLVIKVLQEPQVRTGQKVTRLVQQVVVVTQVIKDKKVMVVQVVEQVM